MKFIKKKLSLNDLLFVIIATIFVGVFVVADFKTYPTSDLKDVLYIASQCAIILFVSFGFIGLLSLNKYVFALLYPILILICSILGFFSITMNTTLTVMILDVTLHNDWGTSSDLITPPLLFFVLSILAISVLFVIYRFRKIKKVNYALIYCILFLTIVLVPTQFFRVRQLLANHIPWNIYYVTSNYLSEKNVASEERASIAEGSVCAADSLTVVFVIGESLRSDHLGLNGYERNTTPQLALLDNLVVFPHVRTQHTYTNESIPFILTRADSLNEEIAYKERSFVDIFKACGYETSWLANQESAHTFVYFMKECDTLIFSTINKSNYTFDKWLDESLLPFYHNQIKAESSKKLIILHAIGSHWWYDSHYTSEFEVYQPIVKSKIVSSNSPSEMINSYDNTVLYTDDFLVKLIEPLKMQNAILIYLSDHGESLGENDVWLHAADSPPIHNPACFVWTSTIYMEKYPCKYEALNNNSRKTYMTDFLFHSILDAASIQSPLLKESLSVFQ